MGLQDEIGNKVFRTAAVKVTKERSCGAGTYEVECRSTTRECEGCDHLSWWTLNLAGGLGGQSVTANS
jgi:hypothetical protein